MKEILISIDVEEDVSVSLSGSYLGIEEGLPKLLDLFGEFHLKCDFFITGDVGERYPDKVKKLSKKGHGIGCHSYQHEILCDKSYKQQLVEITKATEILDESSKEDINVFRAPMFGINNDTLRVLEKLGYTIDSSILPGRVYRKWRLIKVFDYRKAPTHPYHPSRDNIINEGDLSILEIPITENPLNRSRPIGLGFLNYYGLEKTIDAVNAVNSDYVIFLIHPWEVVDLCDRYPKLGCDLDKACSSDTQILRQFLDYITNNYTPSNLGDIKGLHEKQGKGDD